VQPDKQFALGRGLHLTFYMPKITALLHVANSHHSLARALESLRSCDEILVVDHGSDEGTVKVAKEHGARTIKGVQGVDRGAYAQDAKNDWILCVLPSESIAEELEASLLEWKHTEPKDVRLGYNVGIREQNGMQWKFLSPELRLVNRSQINWTGDLPPESTDAPALEGHLLRIPE
jgi:glycosyltransferase involved in cell wall biosynthesis